MLGAVSTQGTSVCVLELMVGGKGEWTARLFARERVRNKLFLCHQVLYKTSRNPKILNSNLLI